MSKHVRYEEGEVLERMKHEFEEGMNALDWLESEIRASLDRLTAMQFHTSPPAATATAGDPVLPTAADHQAADLLAQTLAGGRPKKEPSPTVVRRAGSGRRRGTLT